MMREIEYSDGNIEPGSRQVAVDLSGMTIVVFGAAGTLASAFAGGAVAAGANLLMADRDDAAPLDSSAAAQKLQAVAAAAYAAGNGKSRKPQLRLADITDIDDTAAVFHAAVDHFGSIDIAVNFAGVHHRPFDLVADDPEELMRDFRRVTEVNLAGAFAFTVGAARTMVPRRKGHIIHLCSNGSRAALYGSYAYNASKHGVEGLVRTAAAQLAPYGVRVNGIAPGTVVTGLNRALLYDGEGEPLPRAKSILSHTPTKKFATPDGVAETLLAMCVPQRHLTGNVVFADDGYNVEGHTWPEGNVALYESVEALESLLGRP